MKLKEMEIVVLTVDKPDKNLKTGDVGTIVFCHEKNNIYEVEFTTFNGDTVSVETLTGSEVRPVSKNEILHARKVKVV